VHRFTQGASEVANRKESDSDFDTRRDMSPGGDMRRILIAVAASFLAFLVATPPAWAGSPHFIPATP